MAYATGDNVSGIEPAAHLAEAFAPVSGEPVVLIDEPDDKERIQPSDTGPSDFFLRGSKYGRVPDHQWHYRDRANRVVLTVCRFETPQGKAILQCTPWAQADGNVAWKWCGLPAERPLYDLPALLDNPDATVLVVEGERCVEAARQLVPKNWLVTTWSGGANAVSKTQWAALQNCEVHIWADADEPGRKAAKAIEALLPNATTYGDHAFAAIRKTKGSLPAGWDAGDAVDEGLTAGDFAALFHSKPDCLRILGIAELIKAHPKMRPPLIDGLLRQGEAMGLIAQPKLGKSYLVHALALCVATGRPWIGFSVRRGKVLICDFELHPETLADRLGSIAAHMDVEPESIDHLVRTCCVRGEEMGSSTF